MNEDLFDALTIADERISKKRRRDAETRLKHRCDPLAQSDHANVTHSQDVSWCDRSIAPSPLSADQPASIDDEQSHDQREAENSNDDDDDLFFIADEDEVNEEQTDRFSDDEQGEEADRVQINSERIHPYTNVSIHTFARNFIDLSRRSNLNKERTQEFLTFIKSVVPEPNRLPTNVTQLYQELGVNEQLFKKRAVCRQCQVHVITADRPCVECEKVDKRKQNFVYDVDVRMVFLSTLRRLSPLIEDYRKSFEAPNSSLCNNDIPFSRLYQEMRKRFSGPKMISEVFHLDGM